MNAKELIKLINDTLEKEEIELTEFIYDDLNENNTTKLYSIFGKYKLITSERDLFDPDIEYSVFYFADHDIYLKIDGSYSSWDSTDWDSNFYQVEPAEKTVVYYKKVK